MEVDSQHTCEATEMKERLKEKEQIISHMQEDLKKSCEFADALEKVIKDYQEFVEELQTPCMQCGTVPSFEERALTHLKELPERA